jgi:hypothetical protein
VTRPVQAAIDSLVSSSRSSTVLCPSAWTPRATSPWADTTFWASRTRNAIASRYRRPMRLSCSDGARHASKSAFRRPTIRDTALLERGAPRSRGPSAPVIRRLFAPDRDAPTRAPSTAAARRW